MVTNGWYKKLGEKIWTPWFIKFIQCRGYFNIYTNFEHERALSVSHRDAGVKYGKTAGPDSHLLDENSLDFNLLELYPLNDLKWYDLCFRQIVVNRIVRSANELGQVLQSVQREKSVILVSLYRVPEMAVRNMLCHFEGLSVHNYILVGPTSEFLFDLARRGYPVIDAGNSPVIIKKVSILEKIAPTWMNVSLRMKDDPETDKAFGWVLEMYGYAVASALHGVRHTLRKDFMLQPWDFEVGKKFIIHYTYGCDYNMKGELTYGKIGEWRFDKRSHLSGPPPRNLPLPPPGVPESV
ncbi:hypothetical protein OROMI_007751 [Orobanche minor]